MRSTQVPVCVWCGFLLKPQQALIISKARRVVRVVRVVRVEGGL